MTSSERYFFLKGKLQGYWDLAVWKSGTPCIGVMETPYHNHSTVKQMEKEMRDIRSALNKTECEMEHCRGCPDCGPSHVSIPESDLRED